MVDVSGVRSFTGGNIAGGFLGAKSTGQSLRKFILEGSAGVQNPNAVKNVAQNREIFDTAQARRAKNLGGERSSRTDRSQEVERSSRTIQDKIVLSKDVTSGVLTNRQDNSFLTDRADQAAFRKDNNAVIAEAEARDAIRNALRAKTFVKDRVRAENFTQSAARQESAKIRVAEDVSQARSQASKKTSSFAAADAQRVQQTIANDIIRQNNASTQSIPTGQPQLSVADELLLRQAAGTVADTPSLEGPQATTATTDSGERARLSDENTARAAAAADAAASQAAPASAPRDNASFDTPRVDAPTPPLTEPVPGTDRATQSDDLTGVPSSVDIFV